MSNRWRSITVSSWRAPVAQVMVGLLQRLFVVAAVTLEGDGEVFAGMGVVERQGAGFVDAAAS